MKLEKDLHILLMKFINKDFYRFLTISLGSLFEFQTQVEIAYNLNYITLENFNTLYDDSRELERMLTSFKTPPPPSLPPGTAALTVHRKRRYPGAEHRGAGRCIHTADDCRRSS